MSGISRRKTVNLTVKRELAFGSEDLRTKEDLIRRWAELSKQGYEVKVYVEDFPTRCHQPECRCQNAPFHKLFVINYRKV